MAMNRSLCVMPCRTNCNNELITRHKPRNILLGRIGLPTAGSVPVKKKIFGPSSKGGPVTNICVMSKTVGCRVAWGWSVRVNLYNREIMILPEKDINICNSRAQFRTAGSL